MNGLEVKIMVPVIKTGSFRRACTEDSVTEWQIIGLMHSLKQRSVLFFVFLLFFFSCVIKCFQFSE